MSQWGNPVVKSINLNCNDDMINYINSNLQYYQYNIIDIGCGNGKIVYDLQNKLNRTFTYTGVDCNSELINMAKNEFKDVSNVNFVNENVDLVDLSFFDNYVNYIFLFESTLCMVNNPKQILNKVSKLTDDIILNKTWIYKDKNEYIYDIPMKWEGMTNVSNNYRFSIKYLTENTNMKCNVGLLHTSNDDADMYNLYLKKDHNMYPYDTYK